MDRSEVWAHIGVAITEHFTSGEFEPGEFSVAINDAAGQITIIRGQDAFSLTDTTYSHHDADGRIVFPTHSRVTGVPIDYGYRTRGDTDW